MDKKAVKNIIEPLFDNAKEKAGLEYIMALLRVDGITKDNTDYLRVYANSISNTKFKKKEMFFSKQAVEEILSLLVNMVNISNGSFYSTKVLRFKKEEGKEIYYEAKIEEMVLYALDIIEKSNQNLSELLKKIYNKKMIDACEKEKKTTSRMFNYYLDFLKELLEIYTKQRKIPAKAQKYYKMPNFKVLEIITEEKNVLVGFNVYFSNGSKSTFKRDINNITCINIIPGKPVEFDCGLIDDLEKDWKVGEKYLYEIGLPGKYNENGCWKPLIFKGDSNKFIPKINKITREHDIAGVLLYIMCTCHWVIEFVLKTNLNLPHKLLKFDEFLFFLKCDNNESIMKSGSNYRIYDGWLILDDIKPNNIRAGINSIAYAINLISLVYEVEIKWTLKYKRLQDCLIGCANPTDEDLQLLYKTIRKVFKLKERDYLIPCIDWFNKGTASENVFESFICYFIVIDSISDILEKGKANFGLKVISKTKEQKKKEKIKCIGEKMDLYKENPIQFVRTAYSECILSTRKKIRLLLEKMFGKTHIFLNDMFKKKKGFSLYDIRNSIAHGDFSYSDINNVELVTERILEIKKIAYELLLRIIFRINKNDEIPNWSKKQSLSRSFSDPRNTLVSTHLDIFPNKDWKIKAEWIEQS
jgi:hypothetical protein